MSSLTGLTLYLHPGLDEIERVGGGLRGPRGQHDAAAARQPGQHGVGGSVLTRLGWVI